MNSGILTSTTVTVFKKISLHVNGFEISRKIMHYKLFVDVLASCFSKLRE